MGDVKLAGAMGLYLGLSVIPAMLSPSCAGRSWASSSSRARARPARKKAVPFGVFLALGGIVGVLAGPELDRPLRDTTSSIRPAAGRVQPTWTFPARVKGVQAPPISGANSHGVLPPQELPDVAPSASTSTVATSPRRKSTRQRVVRAASLELPDGLVRDGEVMNPAARRCLKSFVAEAGLPKSVRLGVSNQQIVVRVVELPRIEDEKQRDAAVRFQAAEAIAMPLDEAVLDHQVAGYTDGARRHRPRMQVVLVAARRTMIEGCSRRPRGRAQAGGGRPRRLRARAHARRRRATGPRERRASSAISPA